MVKGKRANDLALPSGLQTLPELPPPAGTSAVQNFATQPELQGYRPLVEAFAREGAHPA
jgi:hypothetical protein